jgi:hypothetical protein
MPVEVVPGAGSMPRRARHLIPAQLPRRGEVIAACALIVLLAHLLFAQLTLILAVVFAAVSKASRWRRWWLAVPAAAGLAWTVAVGPHAAIAGYTAGSDQVLGYLSGGHPISRLLQPHGALAGAGSWLPRQFPLALMLGAGEAALIGWLDWVHTDEWAVPPPRPGALAALRNAVHRRAIGAGALITRDGLALGVAPATGARVELGWAEAAGGVLVTGAVAEIVTMSGFQLVHAALRRRKPVIVVDMAGDAAVARALTAVCAATGTPLRVFGSDEGYYDPFRMAGPARRLAMTLALLGAPSAEGGVRTCLRAAFELMDAVPADPRTRVLDDVTHLLNPAALQARLRLVAADSPRRAELADLVQASVRTAQADPGPLMSAAGQLADWRRPLAGDGAAEAGVDLARAVRERSAALLRADTAGLVRLVSADLAALDEDLRRIGVDGDGLVWLHGWDPQSAETLGGLVAGGEAAGLPVLVSSISPAAADLAGMMNAVLIHRVDDGAAAGSLAARTGTRMIPQASTASSAGAANAASAASSVGAASLAGVAEAAAGGPDLIPGPAVPAQSLLSLAPGRFVLAVSSPRHRLVDCGQIVPARLPSGAWG